MPERDSELPSRILQSKLQNRLASQLTFFLLGVKSAAEAVPAELMRRIF